MDPKKILKVWYGPLLVYWVVFPFLPELDSVEAIFTKRGWSMNSYFAIGGFIATIISVMIILGKDRIIKEQDQELKDYQGGKNLKSEQRFIKEKINYVAGNTLVYAIGEMKNPSDEVIIIWVTETHKRLQQYSDYYADKFISKKQLKRLNKLNLIEIFEDKKHTLEAILKL